MSPRASCFRRILTAATTSPVSTVALSRPGRSGRDETTYLGMALSLSGPLSGPVVPPCGEPLIAAPTTSRIASESIASSVSSAAQSLEVHAAVLTEPATESEPLLPVRVLHDSVQRHVRGDDDLAHRCPPPRSRSLPMDGHRAAGKLSGHSTPYLPGRVSGRPNHGNTVLSNRVIALIRPWARVAAKSPVPCRLSVRAVDVRPKCRRPVGAGGNQAVAAAWCQQEPEEPGDDLSTLILQRHGRHRQEHLVGEQPLPAPVTSALS